MGERNVHLPLIRKWSFSFLCTIEQQEKTNAYEGSLCPCPFLFFSIHLFSLHGVNVSVIRLDIFSQRSIVSSLKVWRRNRYEEIDWKLFKCLSTETKAEADRNWSLTTIFQWRRTFSFSKVKRWATIFHWNSLSLFNGEGEENESASSWESWSGTMRTNQKKKSLMTNLFIRSSRCAAELKWIPEVLRVHHASLLLYN